MGQAECQSHLDSGLVQRAAEVLDHRLYTDMHTNQIKQPTSGHRFVFTDGSRFTVLAPAGTLHTTMAYQEQRI